MDTILTGAFILVVMLISLHSFLSYLMMWHRLSKEKSKQNITGCEIAHELLEHAHLSRVYVVETKGLLRNYYDANRKVIRLSSKVFNGDTSACLLLASYVAAHAIQDKKANTSLKIRDKVEVVMPIIAGLGVLAFLASLFTMNLYYCLLSLGILACITIFYGITWYLEKETAQIALAHLMEIEWVKEGEKEKIQKDLETLSLARLGYVFLLFVEIFEYLFQKED